MFAADDRISFLVREAKCGTRDHFLGSGSNPWWGIGFPIVAALTIALTTIGVPAMA